MVVSSLIFRPGLPLFSFTAGANGNSVAYRADFGCDRLCIVCFGIPARVI
jgi:hypothetical protein